jgi:hypothetical protein
MEAGLQGWLPGQTPPIICQGALFVWQVQGYLVAYAQHFKLDVRLHHQVRAVISVGCRWSRCSISLDSFHNAARFCSCAARSADHIDCLWWVLQVTSVDFDAGKGLYIVKALVGQPTGGFTCMPLHVCLTEQSAIAAQCAVQHVLSMTSTS